MPEEETVMETDTMEIKETRPTAHEEQMAELDSRLERIERASAKMEQANVENKRLLANIKTERMLAGRAAAGEETKEETPKDYAARVMAGELEIEKKKA